MKSPPAVFIRCEHAAWYMAVRGHDRHVVALKLLYPHGQVSEDAVEAAFGGLIYSGGPARLGADGPMRLIGPRERGARRALILKFNAPEFITEAFKGGHR